MASCSKESTSGSSKETTAKSSSEYPLDTCVVSGEKLGSMGDPIVIKHEGTEVRFCCKSCIKKFKKDPAKYLSKLNK